MSNIGQAPLTSLNTSNPLSSLAEGMINEVSHSLQSEGWVFNTEQDNTLRDLILPEKDVEGLCETYSFNLYNNIRYTDEYKKHKCIFNFFFGCNFTFFKLVTFSKNSLVTKRE